MLIAALVLFLVCVLAATSLTKRSLRELTPEEKAKLVDAAAKTPMYGFLAMVAIYVGWVVIMTQRTDLWLVATITFGAAALVLSTVTGATTYRGYQRCEMPPRFLQTFLVVRGLRLAGVAVFFTAMILYIRSQSAG